LTTGHLTGQRGSMTQLLDSAEIDTALAALPGWERDGNSIRARFTAPDFPTAIGLVDAVAIEAEARNHHPDIDVRWREVLFVLSTHSAGGVTSQDVALAGAISAQAARLAVTTN
jgi:4a-hydroxytetrahydrobiopterin dehydratase